MIYLNEDLQRIVQAIRNIKNSDTDSTTNDASPKYLFDDLKDIADAIRSLNPEQTNEILRQTNKTPETLNDALNEIIEAIENIEVEHPKGKITITKNGENIDVAQYATADVDVPAGITVDENYDVSEGTLNSATVTLEGGVTAHIPDGVVTIGNVSFMGNILINKVVMSDSVTTMEDGVFQYPGSSGNKLPFGDCISLKEIVFSNNLNNIAVGAFCGCTGLTSITIPDSVTSIGSNAFINCSGLTSITIPDSVTAIGDSAFGNCSSLTSIIIPDSVTSIGIVAFSNCTGLTDIYYTGTQAEWKAITGISDARIPETATIHYEYTPE